MKTPMPSFIKEEIAEGKHDFPKTEAKPSAKRSSKKSSKRGSSRGSCR